MPPIPFPTPRPGRLSLLLAATLALSATIAASPIRAADPAQSSPPSERIIKPADFPRPAHPPLGINLEEVVDYAHSMMFVDLIKSARKFGSPDTPWDEKAPVDDNGWPTADAGAVIATGAPIPSGDYAFACTGRCDLSVIASKASVNHQNYDPDKNTTTATLTVPPDIASLFLAFKNTSAGIQNIRLLRPGYPLNTDQVFNQDFLKALAPFSTLRLMDFTRTNESTAQDWKDRPHITDARQSTRRGAAWEYGIMLANQTGKDLWINIPVRASDDYVKQLAQLLKSKLNKDRVVYVEYSNEVWNGIFPQNHYNDDAARKEVAAGNSSLNDAGGGGKDANPYYWGWKRVARRLVEISNLFKAVYAPGGGAGSTAINSTIRPVLADQAANSFMLRMQLEFIAKNFGPPRQFIYAVACAPYFNADPKVESRDDATADELLDSAESAGLPWSKNVAFQYLLLARYYRLHSLAYEGGPAFSGEHSVDAKVAANRDPRIGQLIQNYLANWYADGGELFMYFDLASGYGKFGCWGLSEDIRQSTPKTKAIASIEAAPLPPLTSGKPVPGIIDATQFDAHDGGNVETLPTGEKDVAFLRDGSWFDYLVTVAAPGEYNFTLQTSSAAGSGSVEVSFSGDSLGAIAIPNTGDWHKWSDTQPVLVRLQKGQLTIHLHITKGPLNLRSFTLKKP